MINRTIKLRNSTVFLEYDTETQLFDVNSSELNRINFGIEYFKDLTVKMGECEIVLSYNKETKRIDMVSSDIGDIVLKAIYEGSVSLDIDEVDDNWQEIGDNLEGDDDGNIRHVYGNLRGNVCGNVCGSLMGSW